MSATSSTGRMARLSRERTELIERAGGAGDEICRNLSVPRRRAQVGVAELSLNDADVNPAFQKMGGEGMRRVWAVTGFPSEARRLAARQAAWTARTVTWRDGKTST